MATNDTHIQGHYGISRREIMHNELGKGNKQRLQVTRKARNREKELNRK